jgi:hypothetical protein
VRLHPNADWPGIIDRLLGDGSDDERKAARETMWVQVQHYVVERARLPIGPLNEDKDARRDIAVSLLRRLEQRQFHHVKEWRRRQQRGQSHASWWGLIYRMAYQLGIDLARLSRQNLAPREAKQFRWARVAVVEPQVLADCLGDTLGKSLEFLGGADPKALAAYIGELNEVLGDHADTTDPPPPSKPVAAHAPKPER